ncbi:MAG: serine hydrolase [Saprospiraceae bacterium]|nr:serine hydrolase [Saprospiraceae bacterium]
MNASYSLLLTLLICWSPPVFSQEKPDLQDAFRLLETWLDAQKDYESLPGISVAVVKDQDLLWEEGFGWADIATNNPASPKTIYSICSISKLFTAIAIMQLRDAGKLSLEDEVSEILPWFTIKQAYEDSGPITIRGLLTHSSGLPRQSNFPYWTGPEFDFPEMADIMAQMDSLETLYPASTYFQYSNFGLSILGAVIEGVSGMSYEDYVQKNILDVLDLDDTRPYMPADLLKQQLATGYSAVTRSGTRYEMDPFFTKGVTAAAGFTSTVEDLAKFASWQFRLLETGGTEILKASTLREMQNVHWMDPDWQTSWGLGFSVRKQGAQTVVGHGGSCPGYRTQLAMTTHNKMAYVVMFNATDINTGQYTNALMAVIGKALDAKRVTPDQVNLEDYSGSYNAQPWGSEEVVLPWYGNLAVLSLPSDNPANFSQLKHISGDTFRRVRSDGKLGETVVFERNDSGKVVKMWQHSNYSEKLD